MTKKKKSKGLNLDIDRHIKNKIDYYKGVQDVLNANNTKSESVYLRKKWIEKQKQNNCANEYERIRAHLDAISIYPHTYDKERMEKRRNQLLDLGIKATSGNKIS